ncbi:MAG: hypothetical protein SAL70_41220 [Scytonema sp. PMC 1070.18]|nr:hypothetical protein [Scytonema sp. PMC 1070.18]
MSWQVREALDSYEKIEELRQLLELAEDKPEYLALLLDSYMTLSEPHFESLGIHLKKAYQIISD